MQESKQCILCHENSVEYDRFRDPESKRIVIICKKCQNVLNED